MKTYRKISRAVAEVNSGSMADIAFLLLVFFLTVTTIESEWGILMRLPEENRKQVEVNERNVYRFLLNTEGKIMADGQELPLSEVAEKVMVFIDNPNGLPHYSESPHEAVVSIEATRGAVYGDYLNLLDNIREGYARLRASHLGMSEEEYASVDPESIQGQDLLTKAKEAYPMKISEAAPQ